jgi:hypothetical protein
MPIGLRLYMSNEKRNTSPPTGALAGKRFISDLEVEALYGFPHKTLQDWRVLGRGPRYKKFGAAVRYQISVLEEWIDAQPSGGDGVPCSALRTGRRPKVEPKAQPKAEPRG